MLVINSIGGIGRSKNRTELEIQTHEISQLLPRVSYEIPKEEA